MIRRENEIMTKAIVFGGVMAIALALGQVACAQERGITVFYRDGATCGAMISSCGEDSCELVIDARCAMPLEACLGATFTVGDSEETDDVLGCSPDARRADVDREALWLLEG